MNITKWWEKSWKGREPVRWRPAFKLPNIWLTLESQLHGRNMRQPSLSLKELNWDFTSCLLHGRSLQFEFIQVNCTKKWDLGSSTLWRNITELSFCSAWCTVSRQQENVTCTQGKRKNRRQKISKTKEDHPDVAILEEDYKAAFIYTQGCKGKYVHNECY